MGGEAIRLMLQKLVPFRGCLLGVFSISPRHEVGRFLRFDLCCDSFGCSRHRNGSTDDGSVPTGVLAPVVTARCSQ